MTHILIETMTEAYSNAADHDYNIKRFAADGGDTFEDLLELMESIRDASGSDASVREGYTGRGMHRGSCWGIVTDHPSAVIETAGAHGLFGAKTDSMGLNTIVYWTQLKFVDA
jgi:hypothetical protein